MKKLIVALTSITAFTLAACGANATNDQATSQAQNEFVIGETIPLDNPRIEGAFTACRGSNAFEQKSYKEPTTHEPKFAYMAGDGVVVVGLTFITVPEEIWSSPLKEVLATCSMSKHDGTWMVDYKADMIPVVGGPEL